MSDTDLIAAYLAKGGKINRVAPGARVTTEREWYVARKTDTKVLTREEKAIAERHYVTDHRGVEHCRNGLGEWIY